MLAHRPDLSELVLRIHAAPMQPEVWGSVVQDLRTAVRAQRALLHTPFPRSADEYWCVGSQFDRSVLDTYARNWTTQDVWALGAHQRGLTTPGLCCTDDQLVDRGEFRRSQFFNDFLKHHDIDRHVSAVLQREQLALGVPHMQMSFFRAIGEEGFTTPDVNLIKLATPHLMVATRNFWSIRSLVDKSAMSEHALHGLNVALFAVDCRGRLVYANPAAQCVLRTREWLLLNARRLVPGKHLAPRSSCVAAISQLQRGTGATVLLEHGASKRQSIMITTPVHPDSTLPELSNRIAGLIWILEDRANPDAIGRMAQLFDLTPSEARLLRHLAGGQALRDIAEQLKLSLHTVRNQLKAILRKSGQRTQVQLLALVSRMSIIVQPSSIATDVAGPVGKVHSQRQHVGGSSANHNEHTYARSR